MTMYFYFKRGCTHYWSTDLLLTEAAHAAAQDSIRRGFSKPGPIQASSKHPSLFCEFAWRLNDLNSMG